MYKYILKKKYLNNYIMNSQQPNVPVQPEVKLVDVPINDENTALNVLVNFLNLAQKRGAFGLDESAKIWECIKVFQKPVTAP
jgi:hypothetical protein